MYHACTCAGADADVEQSLKRQVWLWHLFQMRKLAHAMPVELKRRARTRSTLRAALPALLAPAHSLEDATRAADHKCRRCSPVLRGSDLVRSQRISEVCPALQVARYSDDARLVCFWLPRLLIGLAAVVR